MTNQKLDPNRQWEADLEDRMGKSHPTSKEQVYHCASCNKDYDFATQGAICPHQLRSEGGKDRLEPWPVRSTEAKPAHEPPASPWRTIHGHNADGSEQDVTVCKTCGRMEDEGAAQPPPVAPMSHEEMTALCQRFVVEGDNGDHLEDDGFHLAREVEGLTLNRCGAAQPPVPDVRLVRQQWIALSDRLPPEGVLVALANVNRFKSDDSLGCIKDLGVLKNSGHGHYWSTHGELRAMSSEAFTHWSAITEPCSDSTKGEGQ